MCAIRNQKPKIAEYFINKGIDINYKVELLEFKQETRLNYSEYSCRSMAYDKDLFNIVDLIDIFDPKSDPKIVRYLCERYLRENFKEDKSDSESEKLYEARLTTNFVSEQADKSVIMSETEGRKRLSSQNELMEDNLYTEAENARPASTNSNHVRFDVPLTDSQLLTGNLENENELTSLFRTNEDILKELDESLEKKLKDILEYATNTLGLSRLSNYSDVKCFNYSGYKINLEMKRHESLPPIPYLSSRLGDRIIKESKETINLEAHNDIEIKRVLKQDQIIPPIEDDEDTMSKKSSGELPSLLQKIKPVIKPDLVVFQYSDDQKYFFKDNASTDQYAKHLPKIKNYYYLNSLKQIPAAQNLLFKSLLKYNEPLFPMLTSENAVKTNESLKRNESLNFKKLLEKKTSMSSTNLPKIVYTKTGNEIKENYLSSLKRSGLANKNSKPLIRKLVK